MAAVKILLVVIFYSFVEYGLPKRAQTAGGTGQATVSSS
jgi:hypothetical protein